MTTIPAIRLHERVREAMVAHAREEAPNECCGLLVGSESLIDEAVRGRNLEATPTRYLLDPAVHVATERRLRGTSRRVIGAYHSHPRTPAVPSPTDRAEALYPDFVWMIVSLLGPHPEVAAFTLNAGEAAPVPIILEHGHVVDR